MRLLVTGGAGFIGSNFVLRTAQTRPDWQVRVLDALTYAGNAANIADVADRVELVEGSVADAALVERLVAESDVVVHFAAESHNDNSLDDPWPFVEANVIGTYQLLRRSGTTGCGCTTSRPTRSTATWSSTTRAGSPSGRRTTRRAPTPRPRPRPTCWCEPGCGRSGSAPRSQLLEQLRALPARREVHPAPDHERAAGIKPKLYGQGTNVRDWIHVDDHNDAVVTILEQGRIGETYLIGADGERNNREIVETVLELMGRPADWYDLVSDRPGHDLRYAIDSTKLRAETGGRRATATSGPGWRRPSSGTASHEDWWRAAKEQRRARRTRGSAADAGGPSDAPGVLEADAEQGVDRAADQAAAPGPRRAPAALGLGDPAVDRGESAGRVEVVGEVTAHRLDRVVGRRAARPGRRRPASGPAAPRRRPGRPRSTTSRCGSGAPSSASRTAIGSRPSARSRETNTRLPLDLDIFSPSSPTMPACT